MTKNKCVHVSIIPIKRYVLGGREPIAETIFKCNSLMPCDNKEGWSCKDPMKTKIDKDGYPRGNIDRL